MTIVGAIIAIGLLIIVHEGGHYLVARWCKMRVDRFSIGFGPAIFKRRSKNGETDFVLAPIPFGGFVQIAGMNIADEVESDDPRAYPNRPVWQRFATIFAGPGTNYVFAVVLGLVLYSCAGMETGRRWYVVSDTTPDLGAHGKLQAGDRILAVNGEASLVPNSNSEPSLMKRLKRIGEQTQNASVDITVLRDGQEVTVPISLTRVDQCAQEEARCDNLFTKMVLELEPSRYIAYQLGVRLDGRGHIERRAVGVGSVVRGALEFPVNTTARITSDLVDIVTGEQEGQVLGPVALTDAVQNQFQFGWIRVVELLMMLNVYLGLFNLLPLPALDGGRLAFLGYEMATRRRANPKIEASVHMVGIMVLFMVLIVVTYKDIARLL